MGKEIITFRDIEVEKRKFNDFKNLIFKNDVNIENILVPSKIFSGEKHYKYLISYLDKNKIKPFRIVLSKTNVYVKSYDSETKWMFLNEGEKVLTKYDIWKTFNHSMTEEVDYKPINNKKCLKTYDKNVLR